MWGGLLTRGGLAIRLFVCLLLLFPALCLPAAQSFDVIIYGATASGVIASVAAAQEGMHVALIGERHHVGGMVSGGLSNSDVEGQKDLIGGLARNFFVRAGRHYHEPVAWAFEPHVAEHIFREMLSDTGVHTFFDARITEVHKNGSAIVSIRVAGGNEFAAKVFIDASYEGDLMELAGVPYRIGREAYSEYGESLAGRQDLLPGRHQFRFPVRANAEPGNGLLPWVVAQRKVVPTGSADGEFQSYCFRLCLTDLPASRLPIQKPAGYDPAEYELAHRYLQSAHGQLSLSDFLGMVPIPKHKADVNSTGPVSTDLLGASWQYPEASPGRRRQIWDEHLRWAQGLLYFLQNDPSVPDSIRNEIRPWGLPKDEFPDTGHWPNQLYIREGRRMLGEYVLTQHDLQENREKYDSIGMAGYNIDIREVQWVAHKVYDFPNVLDQVFTEGYISMPVKPWQIPYRALLPREQDVSNLLVPVCISASTMAYGSFRMEPNYMIAGESAGVAAALAIKSGRTVHQVDIVALQTELRKRNQILSLQNR
jgi:hypothetical protein